MVGSTKLGTIPTRCRSTVCMRQAITTVMIIINIVVLAFTPSRQVAAIRFFRLVKFPDRDDAVQRLWDATAPNS